MLRAFRERVLRRSDDLEEWASLDFDRSGIFAPEGTMTGGDAGALRLAAFFAGVRLRAGLISSLPLRWEIDGKIQRDLPPILAQPDPSETVSVTVKRMAASLAMRGNAIAALDGWDDLGFPTALRVIHPNDVQVRRTSDAPIEYTIAGKPWRADHVLHARGLTLPGALLGVSPIEVCRRSLEGVLTVEEYGRRFFTKSGLPSAVVKVDRPRAELNEYELDKLKRKWQSMLAGGREVVFVPGDMTVEPISITNEDAQFLATRKLGITDVANIVGVPGYFIGAEGSSRTYTNMQDERRALIDIYLREDIEAIEDAFTSLLPAGRAKFDPSSFLRLDQKLTAETLRIEGEWMTVDEQRAVMGLDPLPDGAGQMLSRPAAGGMDDGEARRLSVAEAVQKVYLGVGKVITPDEARQIVNDAGGALDVPGPEFDLSAAPSE